MHRRGRVGQIAGERGDGEHETQMERLFGPDDVDQRGGAPSLRAVADAGQIRGRVAVAPVGLAHDQRERIALAVGEPLGEDAECPVVLDQQALRRPARRPPRRAGGCTSSPRPRRRRSAGPPTCRRPRRCAAGSRPRRSPRAAASRGRPLEQHHPLAAALAERGVTVEVQAGLGVELVEVAHAEGLGGGRAAHVDQVLDEHAERRAPVPDVVLPQHLVAQEARGPGPSASPMTVLRR